MAEFGDLEIAFDRQSMEGLSVFDLDSSSEDSSSFRQASGNHASGNPAGGNPSGGDATVAGNQAVRKR